MADLQTGRRGSVGGPRLTGSILVCASNDCFRREVTDQLVAAGFDVQTTSTWSGAADLLADDAVRLGVVDSATADYHPGRPAADNGPTYWSDQTGETPLIFLVADPVRFDWNTYAGLDRAEFLSRAAVTDMLVPLVCALVERSNRQTEQRQAEARLRAAVRDISSGLQTSDEPAVVIERLVAGVGTAFGADQVNFMALDHAPVPQFAVQWHRDTGEIRPLEISRYAVPLRTLAEQLWNGGVALQAAAHDWETPPPELAELFAWAASLETAASITVPVGDAHEPFGLLWLATIEVHRWSPLEVSFLEHLAGRVSRGLLQAQVFADQREVLRRLEKLGRAKSDFLAAVNHELRTPLTSLTAYLDLVRDGAGGPLPAGATKMLAVVDRNARRLGSLVDDVLTVSRMAANDPNVVWSEVDLSLLAHRVVENSRPAAAKRGIELVIHFAPGVLVDGDAHQLEQVLRELAANAVKFTGLDGRVEFSISESERDCRPIVQICVSDTGTGAGAGIAADEMPDLFTSFYRGANAQSTAVAGSGLGLAIVSGVIAAHDGTVEVTITPTGGTSVCVELPKTRRTARERDADAPGPREPPR